MKLPRNYLIGISACIIIFSFGFPLCNGEEIETTETEGITAGTGMYVDPATGQIVSNGNPVANASVDDNGYVYFKGEEDDDIPDGEVTKSGEVIFYGNVEIDPGNFYAFGSDGTVFGQMLSDWSIALFTNSIINRDDILHIISVNDIIERDDIFGPNGNPIINRDDFIEQHNITERNDYKPQFLKAVLDAYLAVYALREPINTTLSITYELTESNAKMLKMRAQEQSNSTNIYNFLDMGCGISQMNIKTGLFEEIRFIKATKLDRNKYRCQIPLHITDLRQYIVELAALGQLRDGTRIPEPLKKYQKENLFEASFGFMCSEETIPIYRINPENPSLYNFERQGMIYVDYLQKPRFENLNCGEFSNIHDSNGNVIANIYEALHRIADLKKLIDERK